MQANDPVLNAPAAAWAWLSRRLTRCESDGSQSPRGAWDAFRMAHDGHRAQWNHLTDWASDFWIAKTQVPDAKVLATVWMVPARLDQWPVLGASRFGTAKLATSSSDSLVTLLATCEPAAFDEDNGPIHEFYELMNAVGEPTEDPAVQVHQLRAWLDTAIGPMLAGVALTPLTDETRRPLLETTCQRIRLIDDLYPDDLRRGADFGCEALYNTRGTPEGFQRLRTRQGQSEEWQHHWQWMSRPLRPEVAMRTVGLAGRLLVSEPVLLGVLHTFYTGEENARMRALCVLRRWMMTIKGLAWAHEALRHRWTSVRTQDILCFAFGALSPSWPRRSLAISHRSADAKPALALSHLWRSADVAIDASYVPAWESNIGMIWSLFAPVPVIARVASPTYLNSEWCRREDEMIRYLLERSDFVEGRSVFDTDVASIADLSRSLFEVDAVGPDGASDPGPGSDRVPPVFSVPTDEFPPFSMALTGILPQALDAIVLRAAGALRVLQLLTKDAEVTEGLVLQLLAGIEPAWELPTDNPGGWEEYAQIFRALEAVITDDGAPHGPQSAPLRIPESYTEDDMLLDRMLAIHVPTLKHGTYALADVLLALEWRRTALAWFMEEGFGDKALVDVCSIGVEEWADAAGCSLARGLLALHASSPTWVLQQAGQNAHAWPGFRDQPVFTRSVPGQFAWLKPIVLMPDWLICYLANSGLQMNSFLQAAVIAACSRAAEPGANTRNNDALMLANPDIRRAFAICEEDLARHLAALGASTVA